MTFSSVILLNNNHADLPLVLQDLRVFENWLAPNPAQEAPHV